MKITEREMLLNMLKRVCGYEPGDSLFYWEEDDTVVITNEQDEITHFSFDDKGNLIWYW